PEHHGGGHSVCVLRPRRRPHRGWRRQRRARADQCGRDRRVRVLAVHGLWLRTDAGPLRAAAAPPRRPGLRLAAPRARAPRAAAVGGALMGSCQFAFPNTIIVFFAEPLTFARRSYTVTVISYHPDGTARNRMLLTRGLYSPSSSTSLLL